MPKFYACLSFLLLPCLPLWSQKTYTALRLEEAPLLDGRPDDACWQQIAPTDIPLTSTPVFGRAALPSAVRLFYTSDALYVAATFSGTSTRPDGSQRDDTGLGDWFSIGLDTWNDDQNAFVFTVTAAGVQTEQRVGGNSTEINWDAVWQSAVVRQADGWSVEIRLPFTALRFPVRGEQHWGLQFSRFDRSSGTLATWSPRQPQIGDEVLQYGTLEGLDALHQRQRLSAAVHSSVGHAVAPYLAGDRFSQATLGIDGRWGFNASSTLDVALLPSSSVSWFDLPSFPLVEKSRLDLLHNNYLPEPRQLLAEERPMFDKGRIFMAYPVVEEKYGSILTLPGEYLNQYNSSQVLTAAKFSTRMPGNIGLGVYSTLMGPSSAILLNFLDPVGPRGRKQQVTGLSNYTLLTAEKALANNSWVSLSHASVWGNQPLHSNLSTLDVQLRDPGNRYQMTGNAQLNTPSGGDTTIRASSQYQFSVGKVNGAWTWQLSHLKSKYFSENILASYRVNPYGDYYHSFAQLGYRDFTAHGWRQNTSASIRLGREWLQKTGLLDRLSAEFDLSTLTRGFQQWTFHLKSGLRDELVTYYFDQGVSLDRMLSPYNQAALYFRSDDRKRLYYQIGTEISGNLGGERTTWNNSAQLNWVMHPRFRLRLNNNVLFSARNTQALSVSIPGYYLKQYNSRTLNSDLELHWFCSPALNLYSQIRYFNTVYSQERAVQVSAAGQLEPFDYAFEAFPIIQDLHLQLGVQWFFAPISQLRFQYSFFSDRDIDLYRGQFTTYPSSSPNASTAQASLAFIYFLDGNKRRRL